MSAADALIARLPRTTLVLGKGGVGKTTCASALALHSTRTVGSTLVLSTDPARALPLVLGQPVGPNPTPVAFATGLAAQSLDAAALRTRFMSQWGDVIRAILDRGTYLDDEDIGPLVDTALPGTDEIFAALELGTLLSEESFSRVVVDTAPTGHTLRLLNLPRTFRALVGLLDAMQSKHRFMVHTLTRTYRSDEADAFLAEMTRLVTTLEESLVTPTRTAAVVVTNPEPMVREETLRYLEALRDLRIHVAAVVWNATDVDVEPIGDAAPYVVPRLDEWPVGKAGLERWLGAMREAGSGKREAKSGKREAKSGKREAGSGKRKKPETRVEAHPTSRFPLPALTIVAGKGGVGKTTVAAALAILAADRQRTLLVSTDPAPSLADAFGQPIPDADTPIQGVPSLLARQMDATAAFARLRDDYQARVDALFEGLVGRGLDLVHDRAVARDLLALAPPGIDEVYALTLISDALFKEQYARVIVDPAPTGHLLRLLEMPGLALAWSHQLLRLMLKYKEIAGLGETAKEVLEFAQNLRAVDALLRDGRRTGLVLVALDQPVVLAESERLAVEVRRHGVNVACVVVNRVTTSAALPVADAPLHFEAPMATPSPSGVKALRDWASSWRLRTSAGT